MSSMELESNDSKSKRGVSVRLDAVPKTQYEQMVDAAGLSAASALRASVIRALDVHQELFENGLSIRCVFKRKPALRPGEIDQFTELLGSVNVEVTPPSNLSKEELHRLIFVAPEFFNERGQEPYRVDSAYFHRVAHNKRQVVSNKVDRNVLSWRLIDGLWRASVFDYSSFVGVHLSAAEIESDVATKIEANITATIACYLAYQLPPSRILSAEEVSNMDALLKPNLPAS